jgi:hypothetical protein
MVPNISEIYEKKLKDLSAALQRTRDRLTEAEVKADQPSPHFIELQQKTKSNLGLLYTNPRITDNNLKGKTHKITSPMSSTECE